TAFAGPFEVSVVSDGTVVASASGDIADGTGALAVCVPNVRLWSPDDPHLYALELTCGDDKVESYCGFRAVEVRADDAGRKRVFLNGAPLFVKGVLDQAYWPDGLMTAPSDEALVFDIEAMRAAGFNLMRKHIKIESDRWYYHCDRLGMLVLQDMVSGGDPEIKTWHWSYKPTLFKFSWNHYRDDVASHWKNLGAGDAGFREEWTAICKATVELLRNHPSIIGWSLFNEGWGQFCAAQTCAMVRALDPTRFIDAVSGWYDQGCGDFYSVHNYFRDMAVWHDPHKRAFFISEFGGFTHRVGGHSSLDEAYGYEPYDDRDEWRAAVRALLAEVEALEPRGLAGYVYTQVSDIEEETNGVLTYDRRVNKLVD
ncbi:MAG: glycoside hydrolase family 2, partial [Eggerthellaceae bacterium]|nr:glycoside hydrolase family 2 [Eggerthellaceae bacterium]